MFHDFVLAYHWIGAHIVSPAEAAYPYITKGALIVVGLACLLGIAAIVVFAVDELTVKDASAKFLAILIGSLFYAALWSYTDIVPFNLFTGVFMPLGAIIGLLCYGNKIRKNWRQELAKVLMESGWMALIIAGIVFATVSFSLAPFHYGSLAI